VISVKHISASLQNEGGNFHHVPKASVFDCIHWKLIVKEPLPLATNQRLPKAMFVSRNSLSGKPLSKLSCVCLPLEKLVNGKHFPVKEKFGLVSRKVFSFYFGRKTLFGSCEKFRLYLFPGIHFPGNHFPNFHVFVCH